MEDFENLTPYEFNEVVRFSNFKAEIDDDNIMGKIRWQTMLLLNPHLKHPISDPKKLVKLFSEQKEIDKDTEELVDFVKSIGW